MISMCKKSLEHFCCCRVGGWVGGFIVKVFKQCSVQLRILVIILTTLNMVQVLVYIIWYLV